MATFVGILNGSAEPASASRLTDEQQAEFMAAWARWAQEAGPALVDPGRPLVYTRRVTAEGTEPVEDIRVAYMVLSAASYEHAVDLVRGHPHLALMPGNSIDISECAVLP